MAVDEDAPARVDGQLAELLREVRSGLGVVGLGRENHRLNAAQLRGGNELGAQALKLCIHGRFQVRRLDSLRALRGQPEHAGIHARVVAGGDARRHALSQHELAVEARGPSAREETVVIEVDYRGDDLDDTARVLGVTVEHLVARHVATTWRVAFIGFAPGFGYLVAEDWPFDVPRLDVPRTTVPPGAVGLAGGFSGAYPRSSPGGWRLIGRTDAALWDQHAEPPALLVPGRAVRFREAGE